MNGPRFSVWPPLPLDVYRRARASGLPFPLQEPHAHLFARARHGLWRGVQALGLGPGDKVLVPAYHHGSEVEALIRAGLTCVFYAGGVTLEPDERELQSLLGPRVRAFYLIHYLGFPQDAPRWRAWCDERKLFLIEDAAQAYLSSWQERPIGSFGDLAIFCLYKTFGVPDGAPTIARVPLMPPRGKPAPGLGRLLGRHGAWLAQRGALPAPPRLGGRRRRPYLPAHDFALGDPDTPPVAATTSLLPRVLDAAAAAIRRGNYRSLLDELAGLVPPPFKALPAGASPFVFPIQTAAKAACLEALTRRGIDALDLWSVPHPSLPATEFPSIQALRSTVVGLPVHQELRPTDLRGIAKVVLRLARR